MLVDFVAFVAKLIFALALLKLAQIHLIRNNPDSSFAGALAFLVG